jgi:hypothetical protein
VAFAGKRDGGERRWAPIRIANAAIDAAKRVHFNREARIRIQIETASGRREDVTSFDDVQVVLAGMDLWEMEHAGVVGCGVITALAKQGHDYVGNRGVRDTVGERAIDSLRVPRGSPQNRPVKVTSKPAS